MYDFELGVVVGVGRYTKHVYWGDRDVVGESGGMGYMIGEGGVRIVG